MNRRLLYPLAQVALGLFLVVVAALSFVRPDLSVVAGVAFLIIPATALGYARSAGGRSQLVWFAVILGSFAAWPLLKFGAGERLTVLLEVCWLLALRTDRRPRDRAA